MKKITIAITLILIAILLLTGCNPGHNTLGTTEATTETPTTNLSEPELSLSEKLLSYSYRIVIRPATSQNHNYEKTFNEWVSNEDSSVWFGRVRVTGERKNILNENGLFSGIGIGLQVEREVEIIETLRSGIRFPGVKNGDVLTIMEQYAEYKEKSFIFVTNNVLPLLDNEEYFILMMFEKHYNPETNKTDKEVYHVYYVFPIKPLEEHPEYVRMVREEPAKFFDYETGDSGILMYQAINLDYINLYNFVMEKYGEK